MRTKIPSDIKPKQVIKVLERLGFKQYRKRGSHVRLKHPDGRWTQVAIHPKPVPKETLVRILEQAEIDRQDFLKNL